MNVSPGTLRVAVIDRDSAFLKVLGNRLEAAGWQHRVLNGAVPADELVAMKINALLVDLTVLDPEDAWSFLDRVAGMMPGLGVIVCRAATMPPSLFIAAARALAKLADPSNPAKGLLPDISRLREVSATVAVDVINTAIAAGIAQVAVTDPIEAVHEAMWHPEYLPIAQQ